MDEDLRPFGIDLETGRLASPCAAGPLRARAHELLRRPRPLRFGLDAHDLRQAGWGVVWPEDLAPETRDALAPLLDRRRRQAGERYYELTYAGEPSLRWRRRWRSGHGPVDPRRMPWYLLVVGDPDTVPHGFETDLSVPCAVGRLPLGDAEDLAAYAERVRRLEESPPRWAARRRVLMTAPTHPDDDATALSERRLARPVEEHLRDRLGADGSWVLRSVRGAAARKASLVEALGEPWDLWFFAGHGAYYRCGHAKQQEFQGSLLCADWQGPRLHPQASPAAQLLTADDLPAGALDGGLAVLFGCYTAGTADKDLYDDTDPALAKASAPRPFVSALARRLLGRHGGALGVLGHVGRAFDRSFHWHGAGQTTPFEDLATAWLQGRRAGLAADGFGRRFADLAATWMSSYLQGHDAPGDPLDLWIACHDAASWSLLGDPAARLVGGVDD